MRYLIPLIAFIALGALLYSGIGKDPKILPSALLNQPAPDFELPLLRDETKRITKEDLLGQTYALNVWGSWCPACRLEHDFITALAENSGYAVYGLNWKDTRENSLRWLAQFGNPYKENLVDRVGKTAIDFGVYGAPETFIIDAKGIIRFKMVGPVTAINLQQEILPALKAAAEQP